MLVRVTRVEGVDGWGAPMYEGNIQGPPTVGKCLTLFDLEGRYLANTSPVTGTTQPVDPRDPEGVRLLSHGSFETRSGSVYKWEEIS